MKRYGIVVVGVVAALVCVRLGWWQLDRLASRREVRRELEARRAEPAVAVDTLPAAVLADGTLSGRPATARGVFDFDRQIVVTGRSVDGIPAVHVTTPLRLADGRALLVERGAAYSPDSRTVDLRALGEPDSAEVRGLLLQSSAGRWTRFQDAAWPMYTGSNDPTQFADQYPYPLVRPVLRRVEQPDGVPAALRPVPLQPLDDGPHLSYAIQWFAFALIALVGSAALYRQADR